MTNDYQNIKSDYQILKTIVFFVVSGLISPSRKACFLISFGRCHTSL